MKKILILLLVAMLIFACDFDTNKLERIEVSGEVVTDQEYLDDFTEIIIAGPFDVVLDQNGGSHIQIETYESLMQWVRTEMLDDGTMLLYLEDTSETKSFNIKFDDEDNLDHISRNAILSGSRIKWPENEKLLQVVLSVDELERIQMLGEGEIVTAQPFKADDFRLEVAGAVHLDGELNIEHLDIDIAGAGNLEMRGVAENLDIECAGAGTIKAYDLQSDHVKLEIAGVCNAEIYAEVSLDVDLAGMGTVKYKGNPLDISIDKAGIGSVKQVESDKNNPTDI